MKQLIHFLSAVLVLLCCSQIQAQVTEGDVTWHNQAHGAWKIEPLPMQGYVIAGNRYFAGPNTDIFLSKFDEFGTFNWTKSHESGFSSLSPFWKNFCASTFPVGFFVIESGIKNGQWSYYSLLTNQTGHKMWDRSGVLPDNIVFSGVTPATNGGYIACGSGNGGMAVCKFNSSGVLEWSQTYPGIGWAWSVKAAVGGGYVLAGGTDVTKIDLTGNVVWQTNINASSSNANYTFAEFDEITPLTDGSGFIVSASAFGGSFSGITTAKVSWTGSVLWAKVVDEVNTSGAGTPVTWVNNTILGNTPGNLVTSWRKGPVSSGGPMFARVLNSSNGNMQAISSLGGSTLVRQGFSTRAHGKFVVGGVRGDLTRVFSFVNGSYMQGTTPAYVEEPGVPTVLPTMLGYQTNVYASTPNFRTKLLDENIELNPASRTYYTDLRVFPNPSTGMVQVGGLMEEGATLRVIDMTGRTVMVKSIAVGDQIIDLDLSGQPKGLYSIEMIGKNQNVVKRVVIE